MTKKNRVKKIILSFSGFVRANNIELAYRVEHGEFIGRSTVIKALNELRDDGLVKRGWGGGRNARWNVLRKSSSKTEGVNDGA